MPANAVRLGVVADDFTGASDIANTIAKGGVATVLAFNGAPADLPGDFGACVVALKTRSIPVRDAVAQSVAALDGLKHLGAEQVIFKYCSTFDSTPEGNIGPVAEALAERMGVTGPVVFCPAFPDARRTIYAGHLFVGDKLLSESGMENHPLNPMTDPDLRRWLKRQSKGDVGYLPLATIRAGSEAIRAKLDEEAKAGRKLVVVDAIENSDLMALGEALADAPLVTGGSGIALGLAPAHATGKAASIPKVNGAGLVLAGSCSTATLGQVKEYSARHAALAIDAEEVLAGRTTPATALAFIAANRADAPLVYSSAAPDKLKAIQQRHGTEKVAGALEHFFGEVAKQAAASGIRRLVVAGGETSGAVVTALDLRMLAVGPEIAVGVPAVAALDQPLALALKSGNFGGPDFFERALAALGDA
jgi:uncharacterized protein YgbK (DUF1537 family)